MITRWMSALLLTAAMGRAADLRYWIDPCTRPEATACKVGDPQLAEWAFKAWQTASKGALKLMRADREEQAQIRIHWTDPQQGLYGEARPISVDGKRGANVYVLPDTSQLGREIARATAEDPLLREAIVYLTCLHETGHALGLAHTSVFADIMYSFQFGGDIPEYFGRYRRRLMMRADIEKNAGMSAADEARLGQALKQ